MRLRLLVLLAALLAIGNAQHVNFRRMSSTGTAAGVKADTGYAAPVIGYLWRKYRTQLINRVRGYEGFRVVGNAGEKAGRRDVELRKLGERTAENGQELPMLHTYI